MRHWMSASFFIVGLLCFSVASAASDYTFNVVNVDFPSFREDLFGCAASGLNDTGLIVGVCNDRTRNSNVRGYLFDGSKFKEIKLSSTKNADNQRVVGPKQKNLPLKRQSLYQNAPFFGGVTQADINTRRNNPKFRNLPNPQDVNNHGSVTGSFSDGTRTRGFVKRLGEDLTLSAPGADLTEATGINDLDQVVGDYRDANGRFHSFVYEKGVFYSLDVPFIEDTDSGASGINNLGKLVGCYSLCSRGFLYDTKSFFFTPLDVPGAVVTQPADINDDGKVVGVYFDGLALHGFLYDGTGFTTIDVPGAFSTLLSGINNDGEIAGSYLVQNQQGDFDSFAFVAVPQ